MKNLYNFVKSIIVCASLFSFSSCEFLFDDTGEPATWEYDGESSMCVVGSGISSLTITGNIYGKELYWILLNDTSSEISSSSYRFKFPTQTSAQSTYGEAESFARTALTQDSAEITDTENFTYKRKYFQDTLDHSAFKKAALSQRAVSSPAKSVTQITPVVGTTTKSIYIDTNVEISKYEKRNATLYYADDLCYVWIVDDFYSSSPSGNKVSKETAITFGQNFSKIYDKITNVFGKESNTIYNVYNSSFQSKEGNMSEFSDTGEKINIVIYDIGNDYGAESTSGVLGYFYSKDYYYYSGSAPISSNSSNSVINYSNKGKYFYVDSEYANSEPDIVLSTIAHEFQHMINFGVKNIEKDLSPSTAYNEMLSMLCEDMMQESLGIADEDSPKGRLQSFNSYYVNSGLLEYRNDSLSSLSYSTIYAFGAWLARQFGGAKFVKAMMENDSVDEDSILAAIKTMTGKDYSMTELIALFSESLINKNSNYSFNKSVTKTILGYEYPMTAINLWSSSYSIKGTEFESTNEDCAYSSYDFTGPFIYNKSYGPQVLRPYYGISLHGFGTITSSTITFSISNNSSPQKIIFYLK